MEKVEVNLDRVKSTTYFEVIQIVDEINLYPVLLGIDWAFDNSAILSVKKKMFFELDAVRLVALLVPRERERYTEPMRDELEIE